MDQQQLHNLEQKVENVIEQQEIVITALVGNKYTKDGGIVGQMQRLDLKIDEVEKRLDDKIKSATFMIEEKIKPLEEGNKEWLLFKTKFNFTIFLISIVTGFIGALLGLLISYEAFMKQIPTK